MESTATLKLVVLLSLVATTWSLATDPAQVYALEQLYTETTGQQWTTSTNWMVGDPCNDNWFGVTCQAGTNYSVVIELSLSDNNLKNTQELNYTIWDALVNLTTLSLSSNQLTGALRVSLPNCVSFDVSYNQFSGTTAEVSLPIAQTINVGYNQLSGPLAYILQARPTIKTLSISGNSFTGSLPHDLAFFPSLTSLYAQNNQLTGTIPPSYADTQMRFLYLANNSLTGLLPNVSPYLVSVDFSGNNWQCPLPDLSKAVNPVTCNYCPPGYSIANEQCTICHAGTFSFGNSSVCYLCPPGSANPMPGQSMCAPCPEDFWSPAGALGCYPPNQRVDVSDNDAKGALGISVVVLVFVLASFVLSVYAFKTTGQTLSLGSSVRGSYQNL